MMASTDTGFTEMGAEQKPETRSVSGFLFFMNAVPYTFIYE